MKRLAIVLLLALAPTARGQDDPASTVAAESDPVILDLMKKMKDDPALADAVAERVTRSRLVGKITDSRDHDQQLEAVKKWIADDPASAARIGLGLAGDDTTGKTTYEDMLLKQMGVTYEENEGAQRNIYNRLKRGAKDSRLLKKQSEDISPDEQSEIIKNLFEGKGTQSDRVISGKGQADGKIPEGAAAGPATAFNGIYDRLSAGNLRGYSPQLMSLQSALNQRRPPGAPPLIETGKLDYATLSYPAYGMEFDVRNLEARERQDRVLALARAAGVTLAARDWRDPQLEQKLQAKAPDAKLSAHLARRAELRAKARAALDKFSQDAEAAKSPNGITRGLLIQLGQDQKESARWIADAALEEELSRLEPLEGFLTPELLAAVDAVPAPAATRESYKRRGQALDQRVKRIKANAQKAQGLLEGDSWASSLGQVDSLVADNRDLKAGLGRDVEDFARTPFKIAESRVSQPRWRDMLDDLAVKWAPALSYSRQVAFRRGRLARLLNVFELIASGDANGAHTALLNDSAGQ